ncbi:MAG: hypothetical protein U9R37_09080 [Campylobacterota bacterium]|nr:hypothetical protein [Campylobacterota bacterium]
MRLLIYNLLISLNLFAGSFEVDDLNEEIDSISSRALTHIEEYDKQEEKATKESAKRALNKAIGNFNNPNKTISGDWKQNESGTVTSSERANSNSKGQLSFFGSYEICFYFNNIGELDNDSSLYLSQDKNSNNHTRESRSLIGQHLIKACAKGSEMGGKWNFKYSTKNDTRTGSFNISGECHRYDVDLNKGDWYNNDSIKIVASNCY